MDFISRDQLVAAMNSLGAVRSTSRWGRYWLSRELAARRQRTLLDALVGGHLAPYAAIRSRASHGGRASVDAAAADVLAHQRSGFAAWPDLAHLAPTQVADPYMTQAPSASLLTGGSLRYAGQDPSGSVVTLAGGSRFAIHVRRTRAGGLGEVFVRRGQGFTREVALQARSGKYMPTTRRAGSASCRKPEITGGLEHPARSCPSTGLGNYADGQP